MTKRQQLKRAGFTVGPRDPRLNRRYPGIFMVVEDYDESELPTDDGANGPWCIVGNDLKALISQAYELFKGDLTAKGVQVTHDGQ